ncbi:MAG TPA: hypothetical protein VFU40_11655 [Gemmatimonadales bacterium]|nr:hypothetical protein [Gemmatimonadales bacterium]
MLTPAEEQGLSGLALASRVYHALYGLGEARISDMIRLLHQGAGERHLIYLHEGAMETIRVLPCPITILPDQLAYVRHVTLTIQAALERLPELYLRDDKVRDILRLPDAEESWLRECWSESQRRHNPVFGRLDALIDFTSPMWKESFRFVEPNLTGIGGLHMVPTSERLVAEVVVPALQGQDGGLRFERVTDIRDLLAREIVGHLHAMGQGRQVCLIEPKYADDGPDEQEEVARYLREQHGLTVMHADPSELELHRGKVLYQGQQVDLGYRDYSVSDLMDLQDEGVDVAPMRTLLRENRAVSSIAADLDQKSCWEVLTDPDLSRRYFTGEEQDVFQRHILWTRILSDRKTVLPDGRPGPLLEYVCTHYDTLVLKPNRCYGGEGIVLGCSVTRADWDAAIEAALSDPERWVVQQLASIPVREFPVMTPEGRVHAEPFYTVMGFAASEHGMAILARASQKQVVNVAQRGGLAVVMVSRSVPEIGSTS